MTSRRARFELSPGTLPVMTCGLNGQGFTRQFRPTYVTAEWAGDVLKQVQVWGPRLLEDGSLGERDLDHRWTKPAVEGGVKLSDLPPAVATLLGSHIERG